VLMQLPPSSGRLTDQKAKVKSMYEWTFSATAEWVVGALLIAAIVAVAFV